MSLKLYYQYCVVPFCENNTKRTPTKLFILVPHEPEMRKQWLDLAGRDWRKLSPKTTMFFCEDHFDLPNDMENYIQYTVQGYIKKIRMKQGGLPSKFDCQPDRKRTAPSVSPSEGIKKRKEIIEGALKEYEAKITDMSEASNSETKRTDSLDDKDVSQSRVQVNPENMPAEIVCHQEKRQDKSVQAYIHPKYRSKGTQIMSRLSSIVTSPVKRCTVNVAISPLKTEFPSTSGTTKVKRRLCLEDEQTSESEVSLYTPSVEQKSSSSLSIKSSQNKLFSDSSINDQILEIEMKSFKQEALCQTLKKIKRRPRFYIGVAKTCYYLINIIEKQYNIPEEHILLCLKKIRLDTKFSKLGDEFGVSLHYASKIFFKNIPIIAKALQPFIIKFDENTEKAIRLNLPIAFRHRYYNVSCIIDCLEIEIQKPSKAVNQALTWSEYKKANTIKYLISCTPAGLINYISPGYGGRISDVMLVENCNFLDTLQPGTCILADRGFKHLEQLLSQRGFRLLRPPSVPSGQKLSKKEARQTKQIASLRIHVERVIRRVREFAFLKPHSVINTNLLRVVDEITIITCAVINLQDSIIK